VIIDRIPFALKLETVLKQLGLDGGGDTEDEIREIKDELDKIARPKAMYCVADIEDKKGDGIAVGGYYFGSRVLADNTGKVARVFPYVATCGAEASRYVASLEPLTQYFAGFLKIQLLNSATAALFNQIHTKYDIKKSAKMNPGSIRDWPLTEQRSLFALLGDPAGAVGVTLSESCLMWPAKSVSGFLFETDSDYENCMLCTMEDCPNRRIEYDPHLAEKYA